MIKKIGILTSGGDAPGMNSAVRAVVHAGISHGLEVYGVIDGYRGLVQGDIIRLTEKEVESIGSRGGTFLGTARLPEFKEEAVRKIAVENLKKFGIEALVVIGGDGSYMGARKLTEMGINCVGLPGTIDNDVTSTDYTIGFDTAMNTIVEAVDRVRDTMGSHQRLGIVEVMGNNCGDLALYSSIGLAPDFMLNRDHTVPEEEIIAYLKNLKETQHRGALIIVAEKLIPDLKGFAKRIQEGSGYEPKITVLGHTQRGGAPSAFDRYLASSMGVYAVDCLLAGKGGICICMVDNKIIDRDILESLALPRNIHPTDLRNVDLVK